MKIIVIDCRRVLDSGIGRVTEWFLQNVVPELSKNYLVKYLVTPNTREDYQVPLEDCIVVGYKPLSREELYMMPQLLSDNGCHLFISPQINVSPFHLCRTVNMLHDLWYVVHPEFLPEPKDIQQRFDSGSSSYIDHISPWLTEEKASRFLTKEGMDCWMASLRTKKPASIYIWSQLCLFSIMSDLIVCVTEDVESSFRRLFRRDSGITTIENSLSDSWFTPQSAIAKEKEGFLCMAKLEERKNLPMLLDAYDSYCHIVHHPQTLTIAGDYGYEECAKSILDRIDEMNHRYGVERIRYIRSARTEQVHLLLEKAALLVHPSLYESFGYPPLEAIAAGIPVASTPTGKMRGGIGKYVHLFDPNDVERLTSILTEFHERPETYHAKAEDAKRFLRNEIDNAGKVNRWMTAIDQFMQNS